MPSLADGRYTIRASNPGGTAEQVLVIDTQPPRGPVIVPVQTTDQSTPVITGRVVLTAEESFSVVLDGVVYRPGDGCLGLSGDAWSLQVPVRNLLRPAETGGGFSGTYEVVARIEDRAGNLLTDGTRGELVVRDDQPPALDLAPSDPTTVDRLRVVVPGRPQVLVDETDAAILGDNSGRIRSLEISVLDLRDGAAELLQLGEVSFPANGSGDARRAISVGGIRVDAWFQTGRFSIFKADAPTFSAAEAERVLRAIRFVPASGVATPGDRRVVLRAVDDAGNSSAPAAATCRVAGPVDHFEVTADSTQVVAGGTLMIMAQAVDAAGTPVLMEGRRVEWSQSGTPGALGASAGVLDAQGRASVTLGTPTRSGLWTEVIAVDPEHPAISGTSARLVTIAGPAHQLAFRQEPSDTIAGMAIHPSPVVEIQDVHGNRVDGAGVTVTLSWESEVVGRETPSMTRVPVPGGMVSFDALQATFAGGGYRLRVETPGLAGSVSRPFAVIPAGPDAARSMISPVSASIPADGVAIQWLTIQARDAFGNPLLIGGATVAVTRSGGLGSLGNVEDQGDGNYRVKVTAPSITGTGTFVASIHGQTIRNGTDGIAEARLEYRDVTAPLIIGLEEVSVSENSPNVTTYTANEPVTWSISGGADAARFVVTDGVLSFAIAPDFEAPGDTDGDNVYRVVLRATDVAGNSTDRAITVTVGDVDEVAPEITG
ncbi:MAG: Ig-like domain-containing protein, partial [Verrucomicrobiota bacterium]